MKATRFVLAWLHIAALTTSTFAAASSTNYSDQWWVPSESGWGINLAHQGDTIFATWYTYDTAGEPWWLSMTANKTAEGTYTGTLLRTTGPAFSAIPFDPAMVTRTPVGTGRLTFSDANNGEFAYTVEGVQQTKVIIRQAFGPLTTCTYEAQPPLGEATNYQDLWWVANGAESGWGVNLTHQGDIIFATWFTYDVDGSVLWLSGTLPKVDTGLYTGALERTTGPPFNAQPFDPNRVTRTPIGTLTIKFSDGNTGTFTYSMYRVTQTKAITRQVFYPPAATTCIQGAVPQWARTGNFSFARWDGGPLEASKGALSGWPGFVIPDPEVIYATENLYDPATIQLLERAHVNWIWVTWSTGFSNQTEEPQHVLLRRYIEECHRHGIHVTAYLSIGNIFWEDMFANVPESRNWILKLNGQPVPYPAADYAAVGRVTRYMADLSLEAWQEYTLGRVIAAVNAGADGIMFDNSLSIYSPELLEQFTARALAEARKRNPEVLLSSNYDITQILSARVENAITSEQGWEPGIFDSQGTPPDSWNAPASFVRVSQGLLVLNAGLLRALRAVSQGVRPVTVEYGNRHSGDRFLNALPPSHQKLALAESAAFHAANEQYHESTSLRDLYFGQQAALENWDAVAQYNSFLQRYAEFYREPESMAGVAVIVDAHVNDIAFLNTLAAHNLMYDVIFEVDATPENLAGYRIVIAAPSVAVRSGWRRYEDVMPGEFEAVSPGSVIAPDSVVANFHGQSQTSRVLVHLLNYADTPTLGIDLTVRGRFTSASLFSPDIDPSSLSVYDIGQSTRVRIPELRIYDLVVLEP